MPVPPVNLALLAYDEPLGPGRVRVERTGPGQLVVTVGPPPVGRQLAALAPVAVLFGFLSTWLGLLLFGVLFRPGAIPADRLLVLPTLLVWAAAGTEFGLSFRNWSAPTRLAVDGDAFRFPYPTPRSRIEELPARLVVRLGVVARRSRLLRRDRAALEVGLERGPRFQLLLGYPRSTLDELTDLLGPALGLDRADDESASGDGKNLGG
ncbi:MAG: hypothetical protein JWO31_2668 [Phycisphaerales bacterium]|nr:hypothetical protein [Phycisphaerales bacterium]